MEDTRPHILVLDDERDTADRMVRLLTLWGFDARAYYAGPAALDAARTWQPQAVLPDLGMPRLDGCEFVRLFRALPGYGAGVIVAVTGHATAAARALARAAGVDHYLIKPVDLDRLRELLDRVLRQPGPVDRGRRSSLTSAEVTGEPPEWL